MFHRRIPIIAIVLLGLLATNQGLNATHATEPPAKETAQPVSDAESQGTASKEGGASQRKGRGLGPQASGDLPYGSGYRLRLRRHGSGDGSECNGQGRGRGRHGRHN